VQTPSASDLKGITNTSPGWGIWNVLQK